MKSKFLFCLLCLLSAHTAAEAADAPARVTARLKFMAWDDALLGYGIRPESKITPVSLMPDMLSDEVVYEGPARLELAKASPADVTADGTEAPKPKIKAAAPSNKTTVSSKEPPFAWINLPSNLGTLHFILAVSPGKWDGGIMAIPDPPGSFPPGSLRFVNLCPYKLEVRIGKNAIQIAPKESKSIRSAVPNHTYFDASIMTYENGEEKLGYALHVFQDNAQRSMFFVSPGPEGSGTVSLTGVGDLERDQMPKPSKRPGQK
jgi:hypothetical protein